MGTLPVPHQPQYLRQWRLGCGCSAGVVDRGKVEGMVEEMVEEKVDEWVEMMAKEKVEEMVEVM